MSLTSKLFNNTCILERRFPRKFIKIVKIKIFKLTVSFGSVSSDVCFESLFISSSIPLQQTKQFLKLFNPYNLQKKGFRPIILYSNMAQKINISPTRVLKNIYIISSIICWKITYINKRKTRPSAFFSNNILRYNSFSCHFKRERNRCSERVF